MMSKTSCLILSISQGMCIGMTAIAREPPAEPGWCAPSRSRLRERTMIEMELVVSGLAAFAADGPTINVLLQHDGAAQRCEAMAQVAPITQSQGRRGREKGGRAPTYTQPNQRYEVADAKHPRDATGSAAERQPGPTASLPSERPVPHIKISGSFTRVSERRRAGNASRFPAQFSALASQSRCLRGSSAELPQGALHVTQR